MLLGVMSVASSKNHDRVPSIHAEISGVLGIRLACRYSGHYLACGRRGVSGYHLQVQTRETNRQDGDSIFRV